LIEKLHKYSILDEAKHFYDQNRGLVERHLSEFIKSELDAHEIEVEIEGIPDFFGPVSKSSKSVEYFSLPESVKVHVIDSEQQISKLDLLSREEPIGIDSEWRPSMNVFHKP
jgi:hypothetical protein